MAYERIEPFGPLHDDFRAGQIAAAVTNATSTGQKAFVASDFMPSLRTPVLEIKDPEARSQAILNVIGVK